MGRTLFLEIMQVAVSDFIADWGLRVIMVAVVALLVDLYFRARTKELEKLFRDIAVSLIVLIICVPSFLFISCYKLLKDEKNKNQNYYSLLTTKKDAVAKNPESIKHPTFDSKIILLINGEKLIPGMNPIRLKKSSDTFNVGIINKETLDILQIRVHINGVSLMSKHGALPISNAVIINQEIKIGPTSEPNNLVDFQTAYCTTDKTMGFIFLVSSKLEIKREFPVICGD